MIEEPNDKQEKLDQLLENEEIVRKLRSIQYFMLVSVVMCLMSLFFPGGLYLSLAGLVFAIIGLVKVKNLNAIDEAMKSKTKIYKIIGIVCVVMAALLLTIFIIFAIVIYPMFIELYESGAFAELGVDTSMLDQYLGGSNGSSAWD